MEKYCKNCGRVFDDLNFKLCPYCGSELAIRYGRQPIPRKLRHEVFKRDGYRCRECGASKDETSLEIDHILPVAKGGTNDIDNLQTLCKECNRMKHTDEWVGGETDLELIENELFMLEEKLKDAKQSLKQAKNEDEMLDIKFTIKKLEKEYIPQVKDKLNKSIQKEKDTEVKLKKQKEEKERKERLFKKLYVEIDYDVLLELPGYFSLNGSSLDDNLRKIVNKYDEKEIYNAIPAAKIKALKKGINLEQLDNIEEEVILQFCEENNINATSKEKFINYIIMLSPKKRNAMMYSLELFNLECLGKLLLYHKYKHLKGETLLLLCKHDSIKFTTTHDVVYYFITRYTEDQILDFIKIEKSKMKK